MFMKKKPVVRALRHALTAFGLTTGVAAGVLLGAFAPVTGARAADAVGAVGAVGAEGAGAKQIVGSLTNRVEEAVKTGDLTPLAPAAAAASNSANTTTSKASSSKRAPEDYDEHDFPEIPARYLRPDAAAADHQRALKDLRKTVDASAAAAKQTKSASSSSLVKGEKTAAAATTAAAAAASESTHAYSKVSINTSSIIPMKPGENVFIPISREHPNRLLTPFSNPQIISTTLQGGRKAGECGEACVRGGVVYITTDSPSAVTAFITEKGHEDVAFSVTMVPQAIPPREVKFTLPESVVEELRRFKSGGAATKRAEAWETSQPYVETLKLAMRSVALGRVPEGYTLRTVKASDRIPHCTHPGFDVSFAGGQVMEGFNLDLYVGVVTNIADRPVEFRNQNCGSWRNAAVTTWPKALLAPGERTEIYIAVKHEEEVPADMVRRPLIEREFN